MYVVGTLVCTSQIPGNLDRTSYNINRYMYIHTRKEGDHIDLLFIKDLFKSPNHCYLL